MSTPFDDLCVALEAALAHPHQRARLTEVFIAFAQHGDAHLDELCDRLLTYPTVESIFRTCSSQNQIK